MQLPDKAVGIVISQYGSVNEMLVTDGMKLVWLGKRKQERLPCSSSSSMSWESRHGLEPAMTAVETNYLINSINCMSAYLGSKLAGVFNGTVIQRVC